MVNRKKIEYDRNYRIINREKINEYQRNWYRKNPEKREKKLVYSRNYHRIHYNNSKIKLMILLGGVECSCNDNDCWHINKCGIKNERLLQFDHINGGGTKELKMRNNNYSRYIFWYKDPNIKSKLRVLCANCHCMKTYKKTEYPKGKPKTYK